MPDDTRPFVGIALPFLTLKSRPFISIAKTLCMTWKSANIALLTVEGLYIQFNRCLLVDQALAQGCSHIFFVDSDVIFDGETTLPKLLAHDKDIVAAPYNKKVKPVESAVYLFDEKGERVPAEKYPTTLFKADIAPTGCMLIKTHIFEKLSYPWFQITMDVESHMLDWSEDVYFCKLATEAGFEIWVDPTIKVGHIGDYVY